MLHSLRKSATIPNILSQHTIILMNLRKTYDRHVSICVTKPTAITLTTASTPTIGLGEPTTLPGHSMECCSNQKLGPCFFGPYQVLHRINFVAYELQLSLTVCILPVFHVSLLRPFKGVHDVSELSSTKKSNFLSPQTHNSTQHLTPNYLNALHEGAKTNMPHNPHSEQANSQDLKPSDAAFQNVALTP